MSNVSNSSSPSSSRSGLLSKMFKKPVSKQTHPYSYPSTSGRDSGTCPLDLSGLRRIDSKIQRGRLSVLRVRVKAPTRARRPILTLFSAHLLPHTGGAACILFLPFLRSRPPRVNRRKRRTNTNMPVPRHNRMRPRPLPPPLRLLTSKRSLTSHRDTAMLRLSPVVIGKYKPFWAVSAYQCTCSDDMRRMKKARKYGKWDGRNTLPRTIVSFLRR